MIKKKLLLFIFIFLASFIIVKPTLAFGGGEIIQNNDTTIAEQQSVENVVIFGSDATIKGTVKENIVVIDGNLNIKKTANIHGVVLVIGGSIHQDPGAKVPEDVLNFSFGNGASLGFIISGILLITSWGLRLGFSLLFILLAILASLIMKQRMNTVTEYYQQKPIRIIITGAITSVLLIPISILLTASIIGIPVVILLFIIWLIFFVIGMGVFSQIISKWLVNHEQRSQWLNVLYGSMIIIGLMNLPFIGFLLVLTLIWASSGYMVTWLYNKIRYRKTAS